MTDLEKLTALAWAVRRGFERYVTKTYGWVDPDLGGYCYEASARLFRLAKTHGLDVSLCKGHGHWFVMLDGKVVDVTSTQFKQPEKVAVLTQEEAEKRGDWWKLLEACVVPPYSTCQSGEDEEIEKELLSVAETLNA